MSYFGRPDKPFTASSHIGIYTIAPLDASGLYGTFTAAPTLIPLNKALQPCAGVAINNGGLLLDNGSYLITTPIGARSVAGVAASIETTWVINSNFANFTQHTASFFANSANTNTVGSCRQGGVGPTAFVTTTAQVTLFFVVTAVSGQTWNIETYSTPIIVMRTS